MPQSNKAFLQMMQVLSATTNNDAMLHDPAEHLFIVIKQDHLRRIAQDLIVKGQPNTLLTKITEFATIMAQLNQEGYINIKDRYGTDEKGTYIDLAIKIAESLGVDINDPSCRGLICTCPTECDCQSYDAGLVSNECPIHNENPQPAIDCPQHGSE
jgi:hypothetical protein